MEGWGERLLRAGSREHGNGGSEDRTLTLEEFCCKGEQRIEEAVREKDKSRKGFLKHWKLLQHASILIGIIW